MRFVNESRLDAIDVKCEIEGPPFTSFQLLATPQLPRIGIVLSIRSWDNVTREIHPAIACTLLYRHIGDYIGASGRLLAAAAQLPGESYSFGSGIVSTMIPTSGDAAKFYFFAEIDRAMIDQIDAMLSSYPDKPLHLGVLVIANLLDKAGSVAQISRRLQFSITDIEVPREEWSRWTQAWGRHVTTLVLRGNLARRFHTLREKWKIRDDLDLIDTVLDQCRDLDKPGVEEEFVCTLPPRREIRTLVQEMLARSQEAVLIASPYFDGSMVDPLVKLAERGVRVSLITRPIEEQGQKAHKEALDFVAKKGITVKFDKMIHARMVVIDEKEALVSSADLTSESLDSNREAAIHTARSNPVRKAAQFFEEL